MRAAGHDPYFARRRGLREQRYAILQPRTAILGAIWHEISAAYAIEVRDPTADVRLLRFCLGIPDEQYSRPGRTRLLIRRAMEGLLPHDVQWNERFGQQAADLGHRLVKQSEACLGWLDAMEGSAACRERLALQRMREVFFALLASVDPASTRNAVHTLTRGLGVGRFLLTRRGT